MPSVAELPLAGNTQAVGAVNTRAPSGSAAAVRAAAITATAVSTARMLLEGFHRVAQRERRERDLAEDLGVEQVELADVWDAHAGLDVHEPRDLVANAPRQLGPQLD